MKKAIVLSVLFTVLLFHPRQTTAQNTFPATGNAGIGTLTPQMPLDVTGNIQVLSKDNPIRIMGDYVNYIGGTLNRAQIANDTGVYKTLMIMGNKSAGLGRRVSIWDRLEVNGTIWATAGVYSTHPTSPRFYFITDDAATYSNRVIDVANGDFRFYKSGAPEGTQTFMTIKAGGNIGIGTGNPQKLLDVNGTAHVRGQMIVGAVGSAPGGYSLVVGQGILTERVRVATQGTLYWADYVFNDGYALKPLPEVEQFVKAEKHLPGIPSAGAIAKEGYDLSEMDARLLEKIEELTLYIIELNKKNAALEKQVNALKTPAH